MNVAMLDTSEAIRQMGTVTLDMNRRMLTGPRGEVALAPQVYSLAERLLRRPGAIVSHSDLIAAMYADPDCEPDNADVMLRGRMQLLRSLLMMLSLERVRVRTERGVGYSVEVVR